MKLGGLLRNQNLTQKSITDAVVTTPTREILLTSVVMGESEGETEIVASSGPMEHRREEKEEEKANMPLSEDAMEHRGEEEDAKIPLMLAKASTGKENTWNLARLCTVEDAIDHIGFGKFQIGMVTYAGLTWLADAAEMILLSFVGPAAKCEWQLSPIQEGAISSVVFIGILLGAYSWGILSDLRGRRFSFLATAIFTTVFGLLSAWSPTFFFLLLSRACVGFGLGGASIVFSLCMELLPTKGRGFWLVFLEIFWTVGSVAEALLAWMIIPNINWRWLVAVSALPFVFLLVFYRDVPESPRYLMLKGDQEGAVKVLQRIAKVNGKALPSGMLSALLTADLVPSFTQKDQSKLPGHTEIGIQLEESGKQVVVNRPESQHEGILDTFKLLFSPELKTSTFLLWFMFFANAFTYYGLVLLTTELHVKGEKGHACDGPGKVGVEAPVCYADGKPIIETSQYMAVLITCLAELPGLLMACLIVEKFGRKISLAALLIACGVFMLPLLTSLTEVPTTVLMFGARSCIMGAFSVLWAYAPELYYTKIRSTGVGAANSFGRLGGFLCPIFAVGLIESCQRVLAVGFFTLVPILAGLATFYFPNETKK